MDLRVLGPLEAVEDGQLLPLGGMKQRTVLALLIAHGGRPISTDALIDGVYGEDAPSGARRSVQTYVSNLRGQLGDVIKPTGSGYVLGVPDEAVDAVRFDRLVSEAADLEEPGDAANQLRAALAIWRGHPYDDVDGFGAIPSEISRLNELRLVAVERRVEADLDDGKHVEVIGELESLTVEYPFRERFHGQHMLALYRSGRQAESLRVFEKARVYLVEEMGLDPSPELRTLERQILEQDPTLGYQPRPTILRATVLVADVDDPTALTGTDPGTRVRIVDRHSELISRAIETHSGEVFAQRGTAIYSWFESASSAAAAAEDAQWSLADVDDPGFRLRVAIDVGDVERVGIAGISGPPVVRAAALLASARGGHILLAAAAHAELTSTGGDWQTRGLGTPEIDGLEADLAVHLLQGGWPSNGDEPLRRTAILPAPPERGRGIPGYEWRDQVGSGAFGVVHRAYQPAVGREVAIKKIRPELADHPSFIRRFEVEAQMVARLEHPHILPLYDFWRDADGAFLVMRWMRGGSLRDRLRAGSLGLEETSVLLSQIGPALATAHRKGVVHGDIRAENILRDEDGNWYLSDFGVAYIEPPDGGSVSDLSGLARLLDECIGESNRAADLASVMERGASGGYADVAGLLEDWDAAVGGITSALVAPLSEARNPYKGLDAFGELDADDFHGRDALTRQLVASVAERTLVAVVGPSGIGKSSVVRAGLVPAVRNGALPGSQEWLITDMVPTAYPFEQLASALERVATRTPADFEERLRKDRRGLLRATQRYLTSGSTLLLVIDQFEELFTLVPDEATRVAFLDVLAETAADPRSPVRIVLTIRADFFDRPLRYAEFGKLLRSGTIPASAPTDDELREIIVNPAAGVGVAFEPGLVDRIIADVGGQPGTLPLLEFALTRLFDHRSSDAMSSGDYDRVGGVLAALGRRAEQAYSGLDDAGRDVARQVFLRLVNVSESGRPTRRRTRMTELVRLGFSSSELHDVVNPLVEARLLTLDQDSVTRGPTVEVAHEALLSEWPRLTDWIESQQEDLLLHSRLASAVSDWDLSDKAENYLLRGGRLEQHEAWTAETELSLTSVENEFLALSRAAEDERRAQRRRVRRRVLAGFGIAAMLASVLAVAALVARSDAQGQSNRAKASELATAAINVLPDDPELSLLLAVASARSTSVDSPEQRRALHAAIDQNRAVATIDHRQPTIWTTLGWLSPDGSKVAISGDARAPLQVYSLNGPVQEFVWEADQIPSYLNIWAAFSADGKYLLADAEWPGWDLSLDSEPADPSALGLYLFDAQTGSLIARPRPPGCETPGFGFGTGFGPLSGSQRGSAPLPSLIPAWCLDNIPHITREGTARFTSSWWLIDPLSGEVAATFEDDRGVWWVSTTADASLALVLYAGGSEVRDLRSGEVFPLDLPVTPTTRAPQLSATGRFLLNDGVLHDPRTGEALIALQGGIEALDGCGFRAVFSSDDALIALGCEDARLRIFATATGEELAVLKGHRGWVLPGNFDAVNRTVSTGSADGFVKVWDLSSRAEVRSIDLGPGYHADAGIDLNRNIGAAVIYPTESESLFSDLFSVMTRHAVADLVIFDLEKGLETARVHGAGGKVARISPDGTVVAVQSADESGVGKVRIIDAASGLPLYDLPGLCSWTPGLERPDCGDEIAADATDLAWSPDGRFVAMAGGESRAVIVWDTETRKIEFTDSPFTIFPMTAVSFNPDGTLLALSSKSGMWVYDTATWALVTPFIPHTGRPSWVMRFTSDGKELVTAQAHSGEIRVYDTTSWEERRVDGGIGQTRDIAVSADDTFVAIASRDGNIHIVDLETGDLLELISLSDRDLTNIELIDGDSRLLISSSDGPIEILTLDPTELIAVAAQRISRPLTAEECATYLIDPCPTLEQIRAGL